MRPDPKKSDSIKKKAGQPPFSLGDTVDLEIERLIYGGEGLARSHGFVFFVPFTAPGDHIRACVTEIKKNFARAEVTEILKASPFRITPVCPIFGRCGGCQWQHISYSQQGIQKQEMVAREFARNKLLISTMRPLVASSVQWNYRNRIQVHAKNGKVGFYGPGTHQIIPFTECAISSKSLNREMQQKHLAKDWSNGTHELMETREGSVVWSRRESEGVHQDAGETGFSQVNPFINEALVSAVVNGFADREHKEIWDLYGGNGNFAFPLKKRFPESSLVSVEMSAASVRQGRLRAEIEGAEIQFIQSSVEDFLRKTVQSAKSRVILLDPPRKGAGPEVIKHLGQINADQILFIGCDLPHLMRDLVPLVSVPDSGSDSGIDSAGGGWKIDWVQAFDMFPQTFHVEVLVSLTRHKI